MTVTPFSRTTQLGTSQAQVYVATDVNTQIDGCTITNLSGDVVTVSIWLGGEGAADSNILLNAWELGAGESYGPVRQVVGHVVSDGGILFASASEPAVVALVLSGRETSTV